MDGHRLNEATVLTLGDAQGLSGRDHNPQEYSLLTSRVLAGFISNSASQTNCLCLFAYESLLFKEAARSLNELCNLISSLISRWNEVFDMHSFYICMMVSSVLTFEVLPLT